MNKGILYGVSVGPGDPRLLTLKAVETVRACPVIAAPCTRDGKMVALDILAGAMDVRGKEILPLRFAMGRDRDERDSLHTEAAALIRDRLDRGKSVAMLNLGDVSVYGSFEYIAGHLDEEYTLQRVAGVTSFCAAAAAANIGLTLESAPLHLIPPGAAVVPAGLRGTSVYMKSGRQLRELLSALREQGRLFGALLVQNCGMADERIIRDIDPDAVQEDYFSLVIVKE